MTPAENRVRVRQAFAGKRARDCAQKSLQRAAERLQAIQPTVDAFEALRARQQAELDDLAHSLGYSDGRSLWTTVAHAKRGMRTGAAR